jgi:hypothetical protein
MVRPSLFNKDLTIDHSDDAASIAFDQAINDADVLKAEKTLQEKNCVFANETK